MKKSLPIIMALVLVLTGCARSEFSVSSVRLTEERTDDVRIGRFRFFPSDEEEDYAVALVSPDGRLSWKGNAEEGAEGERFLELGITPGTDFPAGTYEWMIYSSAGTEQKGTCDFRGAVDIVYELDWPMVTFSLPGEVIAVRNGEEEVVESPVDLTGVTELRYTDENSNTYTISVD